MPDLRGALFRRWGRRSRPRCPRRRRTCALLAFVDAPVRVEQQRLHVTLDRDLEVGHLLGLVVDEDAVLPVGELEHLVEGLSPHDLADPGLAGESHLDEALPQRRELLLIVRECRVLHQRLRELLLREAAGLDEARAQFLVGDGQGDRFDLPLDQVDEPVLFEVADLEHAGGGVLREELQDAGQMEAMDGSLQQHHLARAGGSVHCGYRQDAGKCLDGGAARHAAEAV